MEARTNDYIVGKQNTFHTNTLDATIYDDVSRDNRAAVSLLRAYTGKRKRPCLCGMQDYVAGNDIFDGRTLSRRLVADCFPTDVVEVIVGDLRALKGSLAGDSSATIIVENAFVNFDIVRLGPWLAKKSDAIAKMPGELNPLY